MPILSILANATQFNFPRTFNFAYFFVFLQQPERLEGEKYTVQSDIWSLGLSLIEMAIGVYPIPSPDPSLVDKILDEQSTKVHHEQKMLAIFDLMEYIINEPPPRLEHKSFSPEFTNFIDACLKKNPMERADLKTLLVRIQSVVCFFSLRAFSMNFLEYL